MGTRASGEETGSDRIPAALYDQVLDPVLICSSEGRLLYLNEAAGRFIQPFEEVIGSTLWNVMPEAVGSSFRHAFERVARTGRAEAFEHRAARSNDRFENHLYLVNDQVWIFVRETTKQKAQEERYRSLFEAMDDGFCMLQMIFDSHDQPVDYRFLETNGTFENHTGLQNAVGKTARQLVPNLDESWFELYGKVALTGQPTRFENHAPAMHRWFEVFASRVGDPTARQVALIFKDITRQRTAELARLVTLEDERKAQAQRLVEAQRAVDAREDLLSIVSHDLRNPLSTVVLCASMIRRMAPHDEQGKATQKQAAAILRAAGQMNRMVSDLLDLSRIETGTPLSVELARRDGVAIVREAVESLSPLAHSRQLKLEGRLPDAPLQLMCDVDRIQQVLSNLVGNAIKFTKEGGTIEVEVSQVGAEIVFSVQDTGVGIASQSLPHIFDAYWQVETTRKGIGLGLAVAKAIVEAHDGRMWAVSEEGRGSTFFFALPAARAGA